MRAPTTILQTLYTLISLKNENLHLPSISSTYFNYCTLSIVDVTKEFDVSEQLILQNKEHFLFFIQNGRFTKPIPPIGNCVITILRVEIPKHLSISHMAVNQATQKVLGPYLRRAHPFSTFIVIQTGKGQKCVKPVPFMTNRFTPPFFYTSVGCGYASFPAFVAQFVYTVHPAIKLVPLSKLNGLNDLSPTIPAADPNAGIWLIWGNHPRSAKKYYNRYKKQMKDSSKDILLKVHISYCLRFFAMFALNVSVYFSDDIRATHPPVDEQSYFLTYVNMYDVDEDSYRQSEALGVYDSTIGKVLYCCFKENREAMRFQALWSPLKVKIWIVLCAALTLFAAFESIVDSRETLELSFKFVKTVGNQIFITFGILMSQEDDKRNTQKLGVSFAVLVVSTLYKEFVCSHLMLNQPVEIVSTFNNLVDQGYKLYRVVSKHSEGDFKDEEAVRKSLDYYITTTNKPEPLIEYVVSPVYSNVTIERLSHNYNKAKYAYVSVSSKRYLESELLPRMRYYTFQNVREEGKTLLCNFVQQEFGFGLFYDIFYTFNSFDIIRVYRYFLECGFISYWQNGDYSDRKLAYRNEHEYRNYRGFVDTEISVAKIIHLVPVFSLTVVLLGGVTFVAFLLELIHESWSNKVMKF